MDSGIDIDELRAHNGILEAVLNSLFDGVYIVDMERRIIFWNQGAERVTGYRAEDVLGRRCSDDILNHIDASGTLLCRGHCPLAATLRTGEEQQAKVYPLHCSGRRFPVMTHIAPLRNANGDIVAGIEVFRDISQEEDFRILQEKFNTVVQKYLSQSTYDEIMERIDTGAGEHTRVRDLTVFYLDIVGFTTLSEKQPPEEVVAMLNHVFGICDVITREAHGDIDKFIGDAILAVFIDANDAVIAAERILHDALPRYNAQRKESGEPEIAIRIGINSGNVVQGDIGTADRKDLTVIGDVVNLAERIQHLAAPNSVAISETTASRLSPSRAECFAADKEVRVKGRETPVRVFTWT